MLTVQDFSHDPFYNQAFEEFVFQTFRDDDVFLLWQNRPAVVVGCYQNICREVHVETLRRLDIPVVRRMSGGGTVYHDLGNVNYTYTSASKMATGIASGAAGNMGLFVFSKLRKVDEADRSKLTVVQFENDVDGFSGFMYPIYATVCKDTECPYTCALFINYLLSEEGFAGEKSWNSSQGYYSPNTSIQKPEGLEDEPFEYWQDKLVLEDLDYLYEHYIDVYEFIATRVG